MMAAQVAGSVFPVIAFPAPRPRASATLGRMPATTEEAVRTMLSCQNKVFCLCLGFLGNAADARDLTQDTFVKALANYGRDNPEHVQAWLLRIARNRCLDHVRHIKVLGPLQPISEYSAVSWETPEKHAGTVEEIRIVRRAIARLPKRLRDVLVMREYGELSCQEIGNALGIGQGTVSKRLKRARHTVLRYYQEEQT
jgi:RNA polymerase sigma factor (sigma-70 family)